MTHAAGGIKSHNKKRFYSNTPKGVYQFEPLTGRNTVNLDAVVNSYRSYHSTEINSSASDLVTCYSFTYMDDLS